MNGVTLAEISQTLRNVKVIFEAYSMSGVFTIAWRRGVLGVSPVTNLINKSHEISCIVFSCGSSRLLIFYKIQVWCFDRKYATNTTPQQMTWSKCNAQNIGHSCFTGSSCSLLNHSRSFHIILYLTLRQHVPSCCIIVAYHPCFESYQPHAYIQQSQIRGCISCQVIKSWNTWNPKLSAPEIFSVNLSPRNSGCGHCTCRGIKRDLASYLCYLCSTNNVTTHRLLFKIRQATGLSN